jgi:hypothetical protein
MLPVFLQRRETVTVNCENHMEHTDTLCVRMHCYVIYTNSVHTSQETHYVSATKPNWLILLGKQSLFIVRTITDTQIHCVGRIQSSVLYTNPVHTSQETHYVTATKPNQLMVFRETVTVYCENHTEHTNSLCGLNAQFCNIYKFNLYLIGNK